MNLKPTFFHDKQDGYQIFSFKDTPSTKKNCLNEGSKLSDCFSNTPYRYYENEYEFKPSLASCYSYDSTGKQCTSYISCNTNETFRDYFCLKDYSCFHYVDNYGTKKCCTPAMGCSCSNIYNDVTCDFLPSKEVSNCLVYDQITEKCTTCLPTFRLTTDPTPQCLPLRCYEYKLGMNECIDNDYYLNKKCPSLGEALIPNDPFFTDISFSYCQTVLDGYFQEKYFYTSPKTASKDVSVFVKCSYGCSKCESYTKCNICLPGFISISIKDINKTPIQATNYIYCIKKTATPFCPQGYYFQADQCLLCDTSKYCLTCDNANKCTSCIFPMILQGNICQKQCDIGYYPDYPNSNICKECDLSKNCYNCYKSDSCISCQPTFFLFDDNSGKIKCITEAICYLQEGYWPNKTTSPPHYSGNVCQRCQQNCSLCKRDTNGTELCTKCLVGYFLQSNSKCLPDCDQGYYKDYQNRICVSCMTHCKSCFNEASNNLRCTECDADYYLTKDFQCVSLNSCGSGFYNSVDKTCKRCDIKCMECTSESTCSRCTDGYFLKGNECVLCYEQKYYRDLSDVNNPKCLLCPADCVHCQLENGKTLPVCTECIKPIGLQEIVLDETGQCVRCLDPADCQAKCTSPNFFYYKSKRVCAPCNQNCLTCDNDGCLSCNSGFYLLNKNCYNDCPLKYYKSNKQCLPCPSNCLTCKSNTECQQCVVDYFLSPISKLCYLFESTKDNTLGLVSYFPSTTGEFVNCNQNCYKCNQQNKCSVCKSKTSLNQDVILTENGECLAYTNYKCLPQYYVSTVKYNIGFEIPIEFKMCRICPDDCDECAEIAGVVKCTKCKANYILDNIGSCVVYCQDNCNIPDSNSRCKKFNTEIDNCMSCKDTFYMKYSTKKNTCLTQAECLLLPGYFPNQTKLTCQMCTSNCSKCQWNSTTSKEECLLCKYGYLMNTQCVIECPDGWYEKDKECKNCAFNYGAGCTLCNDKECFQCETSGTKNYLQGGRCYSQCQNSDQKYNKQTVSLYGMCQQCDAQIDCDKCSNHNYCCSSDTGTLCTQKKCAFTNYYELGSCNQKCESKDADCLSCSIIDSNFTCKYCQKGMVLNDKKVCVDKCPVKFYLFKNECFPCPDYCEECYIDLDPLKNSSLPVCSKCSLTKQLKMQPKQLGVNGVCQNICDKGYFENINIYDGICYKCSPACTACIDYDKCTECKDDFVLLIDKCIPTGYCPDKYYLKLLKPIQSNKCESCHISCQTCIGPDQSDCTSCIPNYALQIQDSNTNSGVCTASGSPLSASCLSKFYLNNQVCNECMDPCDTCEGNSFACKSCQTGYNYDQDNKSCVLNCQETMYLKNNKCEKCLGVDCRCKTYKQENTNQCLSCISGYTLQTDDLGNTSCISTCDQGYSEIKDINNNRFCVKCSSPCKECLASFPSQCTKCDSNIEKMYLLKTINQCVYDCPNSYYGDPNGECKECSIINNCQKCIWDSKVVCTQCEQEYILNSSGDCVKANVSTVTCSSLYNGVYQRKNAENYLVCPKCESPCQTCTDSQNDHCITCIPGYFLKWDTVSNSYKGECVQDCALGFYGLDGKCQKCNPPCVSCQGETDCISCEPDFFYYDYDSLPRCKPCHENCEVCTKGDKYRCLKCMPGFYKILPADICSRECPDGYFKYEKTRECKLCHKSCLNCSIPVTAIAGNDPTQDELSKSCTKCKPIKNDDNTYTQTFLDLDKTCKKYDASTSSSLYADLNQLQLFKCPPSSHCQKCESSTLCLECEPNYYLYQSLNESKCVLQCDQIDILIPVGKYYNYLDGAKGICRECENLAENSILKHCFTCKDNKCTSCQANYFLEDGNCVLICKDGSYPDIDASTLKGICKKCSTNCSLCLSDTICLKCKIDNLINYYLQPNDSKCLTTCPTTHYSDSTLFICLPCPEGYKNCVLVGPNQFESTECKQNYFLHQKKCIPKCKDSTYSQFIDINYEIGKCDISCPNDSYGFIGDPIDITKQDYHCYSVCPDYTFSNIIQHKNECIKREDCNTIQDGTYLIDEIGKKQCTNETCQTPKFKDESGQCVTKCSGRLFGYEDKITNSRKCIKFCPNDGQTDLSNLMAQGYWGNIQSKQCGQLCDTPLFYDINLQDRLCVRQCSGDKYQILDLQLCVDKSDCTSVSNNLFYEETTKICYKKCPLLNSNIIGMSNIQTYGINLQTPQSETDCNNQPLASFNMKCSSKCPCGFFENEINGNFICKRCDSSCIECNNIKLSNSSLTQCKVCKDQNNYLHENQCIANCPDQYYGYKVTIVTDDPTTDYIENNTVVNKCKKCSSPCKNCKIKGSGTSENDETECIDCESGFFFNPVTNNCVKTCQDGYYANKQLNICSKCMANCLICESGNSCLKCDDQNYLYMQKCQTDCNSILGHFQDNILRRCSPCQEGCIECTGGAKYQCQVCQYNAFKLGDNQCVFVCPEPYLGWKPTMTCLERAPEAYYIGDPIERVWVAVCPKGYYEDTEFLICQPSCRKGYFEYSSPSLRVCNKCHELCQSCTGPFLKDCISCAAGAFKRNGQCSLNCDADKYPNPVTRECTDYLKYEISQKVSANKFVDEFELKFNQIVNNEQVVNTIKLSLNGMQENTDFTYQLIPQGDSKTFDVKINYKVSHGNTQAKFDLSNIKSTQFSPLSGKLVEIKQIEPKYIPEDNTSTQSSDSSEIQEILFYLISSFFITVAIISSLFKGDLTIFWNGILRFQIIFFLFYLKYYIQQDSSKLINLFGLYNLTFLMNSKRENIFNVKEESQSLEDIEVFARDSLTSSFLSNAFLFLLIHVIVNIIWFTLRSQFYNIRNNRSDKSILQKRRFSLFFQSNFLLYRANEILFFPLMFFTILQFKKTNFGNNYNVLSFLCAIAELLYFIGFLLINFKKVFVQDKSKNESQYQELVVIYYGMIGPFKRYPLVKRGFSFIIYSFKLAFIIFLVSLSKNASYQFIMMSMMFIVFSIYSIVLRPFENTSVNYINAVADILIFIVLGLIMVSDLLHNSNDIQNLNQNKDRIGSINSGIQALIWILLLWYVIIFVYYQIRQLRKYCKENPYWLVDLKDKIVGWCLCRNRNSYEFEEIQKKEKEETNIEGNNENQIESIMKNAQWVNNPAHKFHSSVIQNYKIGKKQQ